MKKFHLFLLGTALCSTLLLTTGCEEDTPGPGGGDLPPIVTIINSPPDTINELGGEITVTIEAIKGTQPLKTVTVLEDNVKIDDLSRLTFNNQPGSANPFLVTGSDVDGFTWDIRIVAHDAFDTRTYTIRVEDEAGLTDEASFDLTISDPGTPVEKEIVGILMNQSGPAGQGALDLDDGVQTGAHSGNPDIAEIRDLGIDINAPSNAENWRQQIGPMNDAVVRIVDLSAMENFSFDNATKKEQIEAAFDSGVDLTEEVVPFGETDPVKATPKLQEGDLLVVRRGTRTYLLRIDAINVTPNDNMDSYTISIKY